MFWNKNRFSYIYVFGKFPLNAKINAYLTADRFGIHSVSFILKILVLKKSIISSNKR